MKELKKVDISADIFNSILRDYPDNIDIVDDIKKYYNGYPQKRRIKYDGKEYLICREFLVDDYGETWKQVIYRKREDLSANTQVNSTTGLHAWNYYMKLLKKYYSEEEIDVCLKSHEAEYSERFKQQHYILINDRYTITKFTDCYKYDINGAHNDALREIFPKASKAIENLYLKRKQKPLYKAYNNYFVGMLARKGYRKTYNWIVQRTTRMIEEAEKEVGGWLIYANTDGFIVSHPDRLLNHQENVLGKFKLEYSGDVYTYQDKNYMITQTNEIKGNALLEVRDKIDLSKGITVSYDRVKVMEGYYKAENIIEISRGIIEWKN